MANADRRVAFYMGYDTTPGCIYKFVPDRAYSDTNRAANTDLLDYGTLYVARFNGDGTGEWRALVVGENGLTAGASDPGNASQSTKPPTTTTGDFKNQADALVDRESDVEGKSGAGRVEPGGPRKR